MVYRLNHQMSQEPTRSVGSAQQDPKRHTGRQTLQSRGISPSVDSPLRAPIKLLHLYLGKKWEFCWTFLHVFYTLRLLSIYPSVHPSMCSSRDTSSHMDFFAVLRMSSVFQSLCYFCFASCWSLEKSQYDSGTLVTLESDQSPDGMWWMSCFYLFFYLFFNFLFYIEG